MALSQLVQLAPNLWSAQSRFMASGIAMTSRMTVVRLTQGPHAGRLWLHSPVPLHPDLVAQLKQLGKVAFIVAPSKMHHLFAADCAGHFPQAKLFLAPGLARKRPDLPRATELSPEQAQPWQDELQFVVFGGLPVMNETIWFHAPSTTLIVTDLCQWWQGELGLMATAFAQLVGVRQRVAVPRHVRLFVKDRAAAQSSAQQILQWPFTRVLTCHDSVVEVQAHAELRRALSVFGG